MIDTYLCQQLFDTQWCRVLSVNRWGGGGEGKRYRGSQPPISCITFSCLLYFCAHLPLWAPALHCLTPIFRSVKRIRNLGYWQAVLKHIILDHSVVLHFFRGGEVIFSRWTLLHTSFHRPGYHSLTNNSLQRRNFKSTVPSNSYNCYISFKCVFTCI